MTRIRIMHYLNQFFAGFGGEQKADVPVGVIEGPVGPGKRLQSLLGVKAEIAVTVYCGDDYFNDHTDTALSQVLEIAKARNIDLLAAGPAFASGRYGFACAHICHLLSHSLDLNSVTSMNLENPGIEVYKQFKNRKCYAFPAAASTSGMEEALSKMTRFIHKIALSEDIGSASEEGYIPRGMRVVTTAESSGIDRAIQMLLDQHSARPFVTEIPIEKLDVIPVPPPITNLTEATLALVCEAGVVPLGNPDGFKNHRNTQWKKYPITNFSTMKDSKWEVRHAGFDVSFMAENPNYAVPLDVVRDMERKGVFSRLYPYYYATCGNNALIAEMARIGTEMAFDIKKEKIEGVLLVST